MTQASKILLLALTGIVFSGCLSKRGLNREQVMNSSGKSGELCSLKTDYFQGSTNNYKALGYDCQEPQPYEVKTPTNEIIKSVRVVCSKKGEINEIILPTLARSSTQSCWEMTGVVTKKDTTSMVNSIPVGK